MNELEQRTFEFLSTGAYVPYQYASDFYGLSWPFRDELQADYEKWAPRYRRGRTPPTETFSRFELEAFMQARNIVSRKWMAVKLGMDLPSFVQLSTRLSELGLRAGRYLPYDQMVAESLSGDLVPSLPGLRFRTFGDHNSFCERLHRELNSTLGITVRPTFCSTSEEMREYPLHFASTFDCITLKPISTVHAVWLDLHKPLMLGPDRCSTLFYAENRARLSRFIAGTSEPRGLEVYEAFLGRRHRDA